MSGTTLLLLGLTLTAIVEAQRHDDRWVRAAYIECSGYWNVRYPYLVEVRFSRNKTWTGNKRRFRIIQSRTGSLITNKAVLTRAHGLDGYPKAHGGNYEKDMIPVAGSWKECYQADKACLYVNTRRPTSVDLKGQYCGQNIVVDSVVTHPKWQTPPDITKIFSSTENLISYYNSMKFPFAFVVLKETVRSDKTQTFIPTLILPRTPVDFFYLLRRVSTIGPKSIYCEYPHFNGFDTDGLYSEYAPAKEQIVSLGYQREAEYEEVLCPKDMVLGGRGYENVVPSMSQVRQESNWKIECKRQLVFRKHPRTFLLFHGKYFCLGRCSSFDNPKRGIESSERLGAPIVCDAVAVGMVSSWIDRGVGKRDVYTGTTMLRGYPWLVDMMKTYSVSEMAGPEATSYTSPYLTFREPYWRGNAAKHFMPTSVKSDNEDPKYHRASDDSPVLGDNYKFKMSSYPARNYDRSMFELSLQEPLAPYGRAPNGKIVKFESLVPPILMIICKM